MTATNLIASRARGLSRLARLVFTRWRIDAAQEALRGPTAPKFERNCRAHIRVLERRLRLLKE